MLGYPPETVIHPQEIPAGDSNDGNISTIESDANGIKSTGSTTDNTRKKRKLLSSKPNNLSMDHSQTSNHDLLHKKSSRNRTSDPNNPLTSSQSNHSTNPIQFQILNSDMSNKFLNKQNMNDIFSQDKALISSSKNNNGIASNDHHILGSTTGTSVSLYYHSYYRCYDSHIEYSLIIIFIY